MPLTFNFIRKSSKFRRSRGLLASGAGKKYRGVTRVHCALGTKNIPVPPSTKNYRVWSEK